MNVLKISLSCIGALTLGACGVVPSNVVYDTYSDTATSVTNDSPAYFFRHRRSTLLVRSDEEGKLSVIASPTEMTADGKYTPLYRIQGIDNFKSTTQLKVSYIDNTKFIDELSVTTKDNVADTIAKVGALTKAIIPVAASFVSGGEAQVVKIKSTVIDPSNTTLNSWFKDPVNANLCIRVRSIEVESTQTLNAFLNSTGTKHSFPAPACATAAVDLALMKTASDCGDANIAAATVSSTQVTFAHQSNILPLPLPSTGSLKMHGVCGASVTEAATQDRYQLLSNLTSIFTQAKEAQTAWKDAKDKAEAARR